MNLSDLFNSFLFIAKNEHKDGKRIILPGTCLRGKILFVLFVSYHNYMNSMLFQYLNYQVLTFLVEVL